MGSLVITAHQLMEKKSQNNKVKREGCSRKKAGDDAAGVGVVSDTLVGFIYCQQNCGRKM